MKQAKVRYTSSGEPFFTYLGSRLYLKDFLKVDDEAGFVKAISSSLSIRITLQEDKVGIEYIRK